MLTKLKSWGFNPSCCSEESGSSRLLLQGDITSPSLLFSPQNSHHPSILLAFSWGAARYLAAQEKQQLSVWIPSTTFSLQHKILGSRILASPVYKGGGPISSPSSVCLHRINRHISLINPETQNLKSNKWTERENTKGQSIPSLKLRSSLLGWKIILCPSLVKYFVS